MIDLAAAHTTVEQMIAAHGITDAACYVGVNVWQYRWRDAKTVEFTAAAVVNHTSLGGYARATLADALASLDRKLAEYVAARQPRAPITELCVELPDAPVAAAVAGDILGAEV